MTAGIMNARMYSVTPAVETAWRELLQHVTQEAGVALEYVPYPAPQPLETLWRRSDLGCVFMCGYPIALQLADVIPLAAPIPRTDWADGNAVYRSDLIVRDDASYRVLEDTFGGRAGWTVEHSHSGFNAFRHHLLQYRTSARPALYAEMVPNLVTARAILDAVRDGRIDVGPLDAYWHLLIARHNPELTRGVRVLASTATATLPAFVAAASTPVAVVEALQRAFVAASGRPWFGALAEELLLDGFAAVSVADYARTLEWDRQAHAARYPLPA
jgi:ABC-type phosphate/phosphonate transport system substrate-binding protein